MNYYNSKISSTLAEKLKEKGMPMEEGGKSMIDWKIPTYADTIDWLLSRYRLMILIVRHEHKWDWWIGLATDKDTYECSVEIDEELSATWHSAADAAIEKALELIE